MAGSQSFGKRENEKKKRARRLEKQKRREERQAGGPSSFEEMIAYVDENGRIADTLPEKSGREEVRPEDVYKGDNETYIEGPIGNDGIILYNSQMRDRLQTRRTKRNV